MPFEIRFYGEDPHQTLSEVKSLLKLGFSVEADKGSVTATAPAKERATRKRKELAAPYGEGKQVDIEEAIEDAKSAEARELDDDISDVGVEPFEPEEIEHTTPAAPATKDDARNALIALMKAKGDDAPKDLLREHFKVSTIGQLKETDYAAVVQKANEAVGK